MAFYSLHLFLFWICWRWQIGWLVSEGGILGLAMGIFVEMEPKHTAGAKSHTLLLEMLRENGSVARREQFFLLLFLLFLCCKESVYRYTLFLFYNFADFISFLSNFNLFCRCLPGETVFPDVVEEDAMMMMMMQIRACSVWHIAMGVAALTVPKLPADVQESGCAAECRLQVEHITCTTPHHTCCKAALALNANRVRFSTLPKPHDHLVLLWLW
jgi:hypothetical protein